MLTPFSPVSLGKSFMKIRSAVPEIGRLIFLRTKKKQKKTKKTSVKHIRYRLIGGCVNKPYRPTVLLSNPIDRPYYSFDGGLLRLPEFSWLKSGNKSAHECSKISGLNGLLADDDQSRCKLNQFSFNPAFKRPLLCFLPFSLLHFHPPRVLVSSCSFV